jgi:hypothetical protein
MTADPPSERPSTSGFSRDLTVFNAPDFHLGSAPWDLTRKGPEVQLLPRPPHRLLAGLLAPPRRSYAWYRWARNGPAVGKAFNCLTKVFSSRGASSPSRPTQIGWQQLGVDPRPSRPAARDALGWHRSGLDGRSGRGRRRIPKVLGGTWALAVVSSLCGWSRRCWVARALSALVTDSQATVPGCGVVGPGGLSTWSAAGGDRNRPSCRYLS